MTSLSIVIHTISTAFVSRPEVNDAHSDESLINMSLSSTKSPAGWTDITKVPFVTQEGVYRSVAGSDEGPIEIGNHVASQRELASVKVSIISSNDLLGQEADRIHFQVD